MFRFDAARFAALMSDWILPLLGRPTELLPFDEVRERLELASFVDRGVIEVPVDRIVGTLERERDFSRAFLPRGEDLRERWEGVRRLAEGPRGFPPIELYQVGEIYFVVDGHHRVSVARSFGNRAIEARVREFRTPVPVGPDVDLAQLLLERERVDFLAATGLVPASPADLRATEPGAHARLLDHVSVHHCFLGLEQEREVTWGEAVASWRYTVYEPMVRAIRESGVLEEFPGATETDLYLFVMDHLYHLRQRFGPGVSAESAVEEIGRGLEGGDPEWRRRIRAWLAQRRAESGS